MPENKPSIRIMEKLGLHYEREVEHHGFRVVLYALEKKIGGVIVP
jgi:RimJ/RimL family protein N-acetyltransferase